MGSRDAEEMLEAAKLLCSQLDVEVAELARALVETAAELKKVTAERDRALTFTDTPSPCQMTHTPPFDFAQCETHDTTFPLGSACKWHGKDSISAVLEDETDKQRVRAIRAEIERDKAIAERDASRQVNAEFLKARREPIVDDHEVCKQESEKLKRRVDHWANASESYAWTIAAVRAARSNHPECTEHPDGDVISCGWKRTVLDIDAALAKLPTDALADAHTADLQRQNAAYAASPMNEGLGE